MLDDPSCDVLAAKIDGAWVGWTIGIRIRRWLRDKLFLYEIDVVEPYRWLGVGTCLIEALLGIAKELDEASTFVLTNASNAAAMEFYRSTGARQPNGDDVLWGW
jgi:GNAT superfamily N-acetyltransferase